MRRYFSPTGVKIVCVVIGFAAGLLTGWNTLTLLGKMPLLPETYPTSNWQPLRERKPGGARPDTGVNEVGTLPYLGGYTEPVEGQSGVTVFDPGKAYDGLTLFCSGHAPTVILMDMEGTAVHEWSARYRDVWPDPLPFEVSEDYTDYIRRARVYPNGDLLCVFEYSGLFKLDKDSNVLWKHPGRNHHDIHVAQSGDIYSLARWERDLGETYRDAPFSGTALDDAVVIFSPDGTEQKRISIFDAFYNSPYSGYLNRVSRQDLFHANSVQLLENAAAFEGSGFEEGDILISLKHIDAVAVIDGKEGTVKWALTGMWRAQHQAVFLENGNILLLDNQGGNRKAYFQFNRSKIVELDPRTQTIEWAYYGDGPDMFFTDWLGYNQRLPNGNTLISESTQGRIIEVTPDGDIVWEYYNPERAGDDDELIATVMGATRLDWEDLPFLEDVDRN